MVRTVDLRFQNAAESPPDNVLFMTRDVNALQRPSNRNYRSVLNWFDANKPLVEMEARFIRRREDLVTLRSGRECAGFDGFVEKCLGSVDTFLHKRLGCSVVQVRMAVRPIISLGLTSSLQRIFMTPELREKTSNKGINYYSSSRVDTLVNIIIAAIIFILLVIPVVVLYELSNMGSKASPFEAIGILIIFTLLFGGAMSSMTMATRQELFAASAAYCAVLVVFIGNFTTQDVVLAT